MKKTLDETLKDMKTLDYYEYHRLYQGLIIVDAATNKKLTKAAVYHAYQGKESIVLSLEKNPEYILRAKTKEEKKEWNLAIKNRLEKIKKEEQTSNKN